MKSNIIGRGAEAVLIQENDLLVKDRIKKGYRLPILDEKLRKQRTRSEAKLLQKASFLIPVPKVIDTDNKEKIRMEFIQGKKLSDNLNNLINQKEVCEKIGKNIALLHDSDIIHGDLTTSNMIYVESQESDAHSTKSSAKNNLKNSLKINKKSSEMLEQEESIPARDTNSKVYFIDFGLGFISRRIEDKAVDLHLLKQALEAKHFQDWESLFAAVLRGYNSKDKSAILEQLKKVESRGRYKKGF
jgi:tRNA A-37 threonylcarbamoyl transferase component Bud32